MSLGGIELEIEGRGWIKERGVFGGSMWGTTFFHASLNIFSASAGAALETVENHRKEAAPASREAVGSINRSARKSEKGRERGENGK